MNFNKIKPPTLREDEEKEILNHITEKVQKGEKVTRQHVINLVVKFLKSDNRKNPFRNGVPGDKWFSLFRRRHNLAFQMLQPMQLQALEGIGFTEKVKNTVTYQKHAVTPEQRSSVERKRRVMPSRREGPSAQTEPESITSSPGSEDSCAAVASESDSPDFQPGSRLEVMDFNEKWYPVKVVEVDYEEGEVLVHFEKWSDRFDEWVRMDSNRIRRPTLPLGLNSKKVFEEGEKVIAVWAYNYKYPATVKQVLSNDKYEVLFCDGYTKVLRGCKLFKASEEDLQNAQLPPPKKPAPPMGADPLDPDLGPKEERRLKKRRMDVLEAYLPQKRQRPETGQSTPEVSPQPVSSYKPKEMPKVVLKMRGRPSHKPRPRPLPSGDDDDEDNNSYLDDEDEEEEEKEEKHEKQEKQEKHEKQEKQEKHEKPVAVAEEVEDEEEEPEKNQEPKVKRRRRKARKKPFDDAAYVYGAMKRRPGVEEDPERWNTEIPEGVSPVQIKDQEGYYRESIIIPDRKIPPGWTKHTMRRKNGAKWDVFLVNPKGRKFRSRNELRNYFAELNLPFPDENFDFMVGRKMEMIRNQMEARKKLLLKSPQLKSLSVKKRPKGLKASHVHKASVSEGKWQQVAIKKEPEETTPDHRRIKTLLPKGRHGDSNNSGASTPTSTPPFSLSELKTPDGGYTCCGKNFRKENLFQMHMKHYHPEYSGLFGSTPNVADLAYARTVGEPLEDSRAEAMMPRSSLQERVIKYEADRRGSPAIPEPLTLSALLTNQSDGTITMPEKESLPVAPKMKEEPETLEAAPTVVKVEDPPVPKQTESVDEVLVNGQPQQEGNASPEVVEKKDADFTESSEVREEKAEKLVDTKELSEHKTPVSDELPPTPPIGAPPLPTLSTAPSIPVIKPVSKLTPGVSKTTVTSEAVIVQTTSSPKTPVTITKYVPPGQKAAVSTTKVTISMNSLSVEKEPEKKPTIKTLLPMRPPPTEVKEVPETVKPKEVKPKEELRVADEETSTKSRPRKRTVSDSMPKKSKLLKHFTGSLEEEAELAAGAAEEASVSTPSNNTSYRFSRNRSQVPRVHLEKLTVNPDSNGRVVLPFPEDNISNSAGRRHFKRFKAANKISKKAKGIEGTIDERLPPANEAPDVVYENLRKEEIINCSCGYMEEDGLMIQCDLCLCWQHGMCNNIDKEEDVPEKYVCSICQNPARQRPSTRHIHNQDWLKEGTLPCLSFCPRLDDSGAQRQRESMLKKSHTLVGSLLQLTAIIRSLRVKTHIATKPDHPKLYLWAKSWKSNGADTKPEHEEDGSKQEVTGPQPEVAIDETECRLKLLEHVEDYQHQVEDRLTSIQAQIAALESEDPDLASDEASDHYPVTKQTVQMVLRDLDTVRKVAALN